VLRKNWILSGFLKKHCIDLVRGSGNGTTTSIYLGWENVRGGVSRRGLKKGAVSSVKGGITIPFAPRKMLSNKRGEVHFARSQGKDVEPNSRREKRKVSKEVNA